MIIVLELHRFLSMTTWMFFLALGIWGLIRGARGQGVDGSYVGALAVGQGLYIVQAILGTILLLESRRPVRTEMHILYGVFALVFLPFVYFVWLRGDDSNRAQWVLSFVTLFLFGIAFRAIGTAV